RTPAPTKKYYEQYEPCHPSSTTDPKKSSGRYPWTKTPRTPRAPKPNAHNNAGNTSVADRPPPRRTPARSTPSRRNSERTAKADPAALRTHLTGPDRTPPTPQTTPGGCRSPSEGKTCPFHRARGFPFETIPPGGASPRRQNGTGPGARRLRTGGFGLCGGTACGRPVTAHVYSNQRTHGYRTPTDAASDTSPRC